MNFRWFGISVALVSLAIDQITKFIAISNAESLAGGITIFPGFDLILLRNEGVSFGLLQGTPWWALVLITSVIVVGLTIWLFRSKSLLESAGLGLIIGGAVGNIFDRIRLGGVTDFLDFYVGSSHWPAFNMADTFIFFGAVLMLWSNK